MLEPWRMQLSIDAHDLDTIRVRPRRFDTGPQMHLTVRTGPLVVYCLDGAAVGSIAAAWAQAQACSADLLPTQPVKPRPVKAATPRGEAWPAGEVVAEGHQRWDVIAPRPGQPFTVVTSNWLTVRVHDRPALHAYTHAWAGACALGQRVMANPPPTFDQLLRDAFDTELAHQYRQDHPSDRRTGRGR
jgi:hypothetical protein